MIAAVGVGKGVQGVVGVDAEFVGRDEDRAGRAQADVAAARADRAGTDRRRGIVARAGNYFDRLGQAQRLRGFPRQLAHNLKALI